MRLVPNGTSRVFKIERIQDFGLAPKKWTPDLDISHRLELDWAEISEG